MEDLQLRLQKLARLTHRELEVLQMRGQGKAIAEIADALVITERTVKFHLSQIYNKLDIQDLSSQATRLIELQKFSQALNDQQVVLGDKEEENISSPEPEPQPEAGDPALVLVLEDELELAKQKLIRYEKAIIQPRIIRIPPTNNQPQGSTRRRNIRNALAFILAAAIIGGVIGSGITMLLFRLQTSASKAVTHLTVAATTEQVRSESKTHVSISESSAATPAITMNFKSRNRATLCGETDLTQYTVTPKFLPHQGVSIFTVENSTGAVRTNFVRILAIDERGLWIGYFATKANPASGIELYNKKDWANCHDASRVMNQNINDVTIDKAGSIWVATEQDGVSMFDGRAWRTYTTDNGLPSNKTFGITIDKDNTVWVATWAGVAKFDRQVWSVPYTTQNKTIFNDHVDAITFDHSGNIWVGHINAGVSQYDNSKGQWIYYTTETSGLGGNQIRDIIAYKADETTSESIWLATSDGGVSKFEQGTWTVYQIKDGLPSNEVHALAIDRYNRIWAATAAGVAYFDGSKWVTYDTLNTLTIAFGLNCQICPFDEDHIWTGTNEFGLTHSRLPYPDNEKVVQVKEVCFELVVTRERACPSLIATEVNHRQVITATYPISLAPGEKLRFEVTVEPRTPYQLREDRGDFLSNADESDSKLLGAWPIIPIKGIIDPGQPFTFTDYDNPFIAPQLANDEHEHVFISTWRIWMYTRYVGPAIQITFTVRKHAHT